MAHVPASQNAQPGGRAGDGEAPHPDSRQIRCREMAPHECALALSGTGFTFIADAGPDKAQG